MKQINIRATGALTKAIKRAAHQRELSQQEFLEKCLIKELGNIGDDTIDALVSEHKELKEPKND